MTVLFSELQLPGWAESGEKIGLNDVTFTYDDAKAFTLPCHTSDPEIFFADDDAVHSVTAASATFGSFEQVGADMGPVVSAMGLGIHPGRS